MRCSQPWLTFAGLLISGVSSLPSAQPQVDPITQEPASKFTFIDIPTPAALPCDLCNGPDGYEYIQYFLSEKIARIDPNTNTVIKEFDIPFTSRLFPDTVFESPNGVALGACVIRPGADGNIYAANGARNQLVKLDLATEEVSVFSSPNPLGNLQPFNDLWTGPVGTGMFFSQSSANLITLFDFETHEMTDFAIPTPASFPLGMRTAYDGALWFTELVGQKIGRLNYTDGTITEYPLPLGLLGPAVLRVETDEKYVWFTGALSDSIGRLDIYTHEFKVYPNTAPLSALSVPSEDTLDGDGNIWFCTWTQNLLHKLNPDTGDMTHIQIPQSLLTVPVSLPFAFGVGLDYFGLQGKNQIFFTQTALNRVGVYQLD